MKSERRIKFLSGCKTYGTTDLQLGNICSDPECRTCSNFTRIFKEEVERQLEELKNKDCTIPPLDPDKMVKYDRPLVREEIKEAIEYVFNQNKNKAE